MLALLIVLFIAVPIAEIAVIIKVGSLLGFGETPCLVEAKRLGENRLDRGRRLAAALLAHRPPLIAIHRSHHSCHICRSAASKLRANRVGSQSGAASMRWRSPAHSWARRAASPPSATARAI